MKVILDTLDYGLRVLNIKEISDELLDEKGFGVMTIYFEDNRDNIVYCKYEGYNREAFIDNLKSYGHLNISIEDWKVYRKFEAVVRYEEYNRLKEYQTIGSIVADKKVEQADGIEAGEPREKNKDWDTLKEFNLGV